MTGLVHRRSLSRRAMASMAALLAPRSLWPGLWLAVLVVAAATGVRWGLGHIDQGLVPFGLYFPAVIYASVVGGLIPGLAAVALSGLLATWLFLPAGIAAGASPWLNVGLFEVSGFILVVVGALLRDLRLERVETDRIFSAVREVALDGIILFEAIRDEAGTIVDFRRIHMNAAAEGIVGPARMLVGERYLETSPTLNREQLFRRYIEVMETGIPAEDEFRLEAGRRWIYNLAMRADSERLAIAFRDVTAARATIERQKFLMRELNHRVKNVLTSVLSLARQTSTAGSAVAYREALTSRITAMARAHDLLMTESWEGARLTDIVSQTLAPYDRVSADGPPVSIPPDLALGINMALHELATNAVKYGALSVPDGHVEVRWALVERDGTAVDLRWRERDGPPVAQPMQQGFGSRLLTRGFAAEGRKAHLHFGIDGLECTLRFDCLPPEPDEPSVSRTQAAAGSRTSRPTLG